MFDIQIYISSKFLHFSVQYNDSNNMSLLPKKLYIYLNYYFHNNIQWFCASVYYTHNRCAGAGLGQRRGSKND